MSVFHRNLTGNDIHEPKGADTAGIDEVYISTGGGSGNWTPVSNFVAGAYCCIYLDPQEQTRTFQTADTFLPFNLTYSTTSACRNISWDNTVNEFTYNGDKPIVLNIAMSVSLRYVGTAKPTLDIMLQKDSGTGWVDATRSLSSSEFGNNDTRNMGVNCLSEVNPGDKIRFVSRVSEVGAEFVVKNINSTQIGVVT